ncbi:MAG TPA: sigma-70 family RNA polymerase sigma factor [Terriglobia bacterium]|nr:sigma-70 family RNA polymerase sigma factor [Terriglobia bacterium]
MVADETLWEQIRHRDRAAFEEFYRQQIPRLLGYLILCLGSQAAAEDIAQETFLQVWKHPDGFDPARSGLRTYLFTIARRRVVDWWRHSSLRTENPAPPSRSGSEARLLIEDLLARLDNDSRSLLWLREVEGYSYQELSLMLEIPVGTVKSRLFKAREHLRDMWRRR